jgi:hypothetical protein
MSSGVEPDRTETAVLTADATGESSGSSFDSRFQVFTVHLCFSLIQRYRMTVMAETSG